MWLDDMPLSIRQDVGLMRIESLDPTIAFNAYIDDLFAATPEPLQDVDSVLSLRLDERFQIEVTQGGSTFDVPAVFEVPENRGTVSPPYIFVTPLIVGTLDTENSSADIIDNYTANGAFVRPTTIALELEFRINGKPNARRTCEGSPDF